jgi:predicted aminopeptidase
MRSVAVRPRASLLVRIAIPVLAALACTSCYYAHLAAGQTRLLVARRPLDAVLADPSTPEALREQLALVPQVRRFASELGLEVGDQYTSFVPWHGDRVVTTLVATRPGELEPAGFRFPIVGTLPYKGFFDPARAESEAERLRRAGLDVCVAAVAAYSTLGWLDDPVTGPMLAGGPDALVETLIHELVHATVFVEGEPEFNEGVASFIGQEGALRFFAGREGPAEPAQARPVAARDAALGPAGPARRVRARVADDRAVARTLLDFRTRVAALYAAEPAGEARRERRRALEAEARDALAALPLAVRDPAELAARTPLNDACLALRGTYARDAERHAQLLASLGGDLRAFVARLRAAASAENPRAAFFSPARPAPDAHARRTGEPLPHARGRSSRRSTHWRRDPADVPAVVRARAGPRAAVAHSRWIAPAAEEGGRA